MCANYTPTRPERLAAQVGAAANKPFDWKPESYPGYLAPIIRAEDGNEEFERELNLAMFGLIPSWSKDLKIVRTTYNARSETAHEKPSFREAYKKAQLCVVPIEHFFEPLYTPDNKSSTRYKIEREDGEPLAAAGLWQWRPNGGPDDQPLFSFTILTINADGHPFFEQFHEHREEKRTIALLRPSEIDEWLQAKQEDIPAFMKTFDAGEFVTTAAPVPPRKKPAPKVEEEVPDDQGTLF